MRSAELRSLGRALALSLGVIAVAAPCSGAPAAPGESASVPPAPSVPIAAASVRSPAGMPPVPSVPIEPAAPSPEPPASAAPQLEPAASALPAASVVAAAPLAVPSGAPSAAPSAGAPVEKAASFPAKIRDTVVFALKRPHGGKSAQERARSASEALSRAAEAAEGEGGGARVEREGDAAIVYAGKIPVVDLYADDAQAEGYAAVETYAAVVAARVGDAVLSEKKRSVIAGTVFSISLLVFFGLIAVYVVRKVGDLVDSVRKWMIDNPERITGLRVQSHEVVGPTALRGGLLVALILARVVAQIGVLYLWLVFALSLFQTTRPYTAKLTGIVVTPLSDFAGRMAASLPLAVVAAVSGVALYVLLRFVQLFFEGVARKQTRIPWLPPDLAAPTSVLLRAGIVVTALAFAAPVVTGDPQGALSRTGAIVLLALGLASTPLLASVVVGALVVYGRRVRVGQHAEVGGCAGKVRAVGLVDVRLVESDGTEVRVPHFLSLVRPTRLIGDRPRAVFDIVLSAKAPIREMKRVLLDAASELGERAAVELTGMEAGSVRFTVSVTPGRDATEGDARLAMAEAAAAAGYDLGSISEAKGR